MHQRSKKKKLAIKGLNVKCSDGNLTSYGIQRYLITQTLSKLGGWDFMQQALNKVRPELKTFTLLYNHYLKFPGAGDTSAEEYIQNFKKKEIKKLFCENIEGKKYINMSHF